MIERTLSNLIDNAIRFTPESGIVKVDLSQQQNQIRTDVIDSGFGISANELPYIFDRFYRIEKSRGLRSGATGLGLAIVKKILDLHDSEIMVQSAENVGTTFSFNLQVMETRSYD